MSMAPLPATVEPSGSSASRLLLVDGHAWAYRAFHAIGPMRAPDGAPTNAIFGFIQAVRKLRQRLAPRWLAVIWDGGLAPERLAALPAYKSQRPPMPPDLKTQLDPIVAWLEAAGLASLCQPGVEADDWIATLARSAAERGAEVIIASSDKDFMQLVSANILLLNPNDQSGSLWTEEHVRRKTGVAPAQIVDWLSLTGDAADNIPGVPGVGPKTAARLLSRYGTVDELYRRLDELPSEPLRTRLQQAEPAVRRNQALIQLRADLPLLRDLEALRLRAPDEPRLRRLYAGWGFRSLPPAAPPSAPLQPELL